MTTKKVAAKKALAIDWTAGIVKGCQAWLAANPSATKEQTVAALVEAGVNKGTASVQFYRARKSR